MLKRVVFVVGALSALGACVATRSLTAAGPLGTLNTANTTLAETTVRTNTARADTGKSLVIDGVSYANHGTKDVRALSKLELEADDYYFSPTFLRGKPGQKLTLLVESEARTLHNLSISSLGIDKDIPPKGKVRLEVTFPASGVLAFTCKFHGGLGMNGQLLTGDGRPLGTR
jgi:plastocyanin